jgi:hypothetical protein
MKPYFDEIKNLIRSYKSAKFNNDKGEWTIGFGDCSFLVNSLKRTKVAECTINELPSCINYVSAFVLV